MARLVFFLFTGIVTLLPLVTLLAMQGGLAPFWFLAGDAYLYLGIAQNSSGWVFSFDGEAPTNGFHPLWQIWLRLLLLVVPAGDDLALMMATLLSAQALLLLGVWSLGLAIQRLTGSWVLALLVVPGVYFLALGQGFGNLPVWAFLDGMEAALAFALTGLLALEIARYPGPERASTAAHLRIGLLLALIVLTRLDEVFTVFALGLVLFLWPGLTLARRLTLPLLIGVPAALGVIGWIVWSHATTGMLVPVSGAAKGEGALAGNIWVTLATLLAPVQDLRAAISSYEPAREALYGAAFRVVELLAPAAFALVWIGVFWRRFRKDPGANAFAAPMIALGIGILIKAAYNFLQVNYWHQAYWYFALAMAATTLAAALLLAPAMARLHQERPGWSRLEGRRAAGVIALALGGFALLHASLWGAGLGVEPRHQMQYRFWAEREATAEALASARPDPKLVEFGDGVVNFSLPFPVRHGFVFAGDPGSLAALQQGQLLRHGLDEGYSILTSYEYLQVPQGAESWSSDQIRGFLESSFLDARVRAELGGFDFEMLHVWRMAPDAPGVPFIGLSPRDSPSGTTSETAAEG